MSVVRGGEYRLKKDSIDAKRRHEMIRAVF